MEAIGGHGWTIGVDLGGTKLLAGLFDPAGDLVEQERVLVSGMSGDDVVAALVDVTAELANRTPQRVMAAGYGIPGTIDQRSGRVVVAPNLPLVDVELRSALTDATGIPAVLDNDANLAALAEQRRGAGVGRGGDLVMVTLGTGFGGGIIVDGRIVRGSLGAGAELGHMVVDVNGPPCVAPACPRRGCIETFVSGSALARDVRAAIEAAPDGALARAVASGEPARGETALALARAGDDQSAQLFARMGRMLGEGLANLVNIFNPDVVCVGGGLSPALDLVLPPAREVVVRAALEPGSTHVEIVPAVHGNDAGMIGASILAADHVLDGTSTRRAATPS